MLEAISGGVVGAVVGALLVGIGPSIWRVVLKLMWRTSRWWGDNRYAKETRLNEVVVLTNGENRHRGCVRRGEKIDEREPGTYIPLGRCIVCGER